MNTLTPLRVIFPFKSERIPSGIQNIYCCGTKLMFYYQVRYLGWIPVSVLYKTDRALPKESIFMLNINHFFTFSSVMTVSSAAQLVLAFHWRNVVMASQIVKT